MGMGRNDLIFLNSFTSWICRSHIPKWGVKITLSNFLSFPFPEKGWMWSLGEHHACSYFLGEFYGEMGSEECIVRARACMRLCMCMWVGVCVCVGKTWRLLPVIFQNQGMPTKVILRGVSVGESRKQAQSWSLFKVLVNKRFTGKSFSNKTTRKARTGTCAENKEQQDGPSHWSKSACGQTPLPSQDTLTRVLWLLKRSQRTGN